jgi:hypothetical protein
MGCMVNPIRTCACCGYLTVQEEYDICPVCGWEADGVQERDPSFAGGANDMNLMTARATFREIGATHREWLPRVRAPLPHEVPPRS